MLKRGLVSVKGSTRPAVRLHQLAHDFAEYHSSRKACRSEFIIRQTDQKVGATEYRVDDVDHPQRLMVEVGDGGPGLQGGPSPLRTACISRARPSMSATTSTLR